MFVVALLAVVEIGLQIAAYSVWSRSRSGEHRSAGDGPVVLCIGDSMSYGLGSSAPTKSYPARLEAMLRARDGRAWVVVNGAWPGRDSHTLLKLLPDQLHRFRPDYVCCLIGSNDQWSRQGQLNLARAAEGEDSFPIVWRTGRLIDILLVGRPASHGEEAFVGTWHAASTEVQFQPNGRLNFDLTELRWLVRDGRLLVVMPTQEEVEVEWRVEADELHLRSEMWADELVLQAGPATDLTPLQRGRRALEAQEWADAVTAFERGAGEDQPVDQQAAAREGLVTAHLAMGDRASAQEQVAWLEQRDRKARADGESIRSVGESLAHSLIALGRVDEALRVAARLVEHHAESDRSWEVLMKHGLDRDDRRAVVMEALETAIRVLPADHPWRGQLIIQRGRMIKDEDPAGFLRALFDALGSGVEERNIINHIHIARRLFSEEMMQQVVADMDLSDADRARVREVYRRALAGGDVSGVLVEHLESVLKLCREADAELLLLDYPFQDLDHERLVDGFAEDKKLRRVHVRPRFDRALETVSRDRLFIRDDVHCSDGGYELMAEAVADALLER